MFEPAIKWSGSKRSQAAIIRQHMPESFGTYYEPFVGGGSVLYAVNPQRAVCGDICGPLISLWKRIKESPDDVAAEYKTRWEQLQREGSEVYYEVRERFNKVKDPDDLLFLSRTCVNGLIRFNSKGDFNSPFHHTRNGITPERLGRILREWSIRIADAEFLEADYRVTSRQAHAGDVMYLDPPYYHTKGMYYGSIDYGDFLDFLENTNSRGIMYIMSFDGKRGEKDYAVEIPKELYKRHELIPSGNSSFNRVMGNKNVAVYDSLYLNW